MNARTFIAIVLVIVAVAIMCGIGTGPEKHVDYNCSDFATYAQAREYFERHPSDIYKLDKNHDGIPCQSLIRK